jgi:hypothetical protein
MGRGPEIPLELRIAIVVMRVFYNETFDEIERKTGIKANTASVIFTRSKARAQSKEIAACVQDLDRPGRPPRVEDGDFLSKFVSALIASPTYQNFDAAQIATLTNTLLHLTNYESNERHSQIPITSKIVQRIALEHGDTPRRQTKTLRRLTRSSRAIQSVCGPYKS